MGLQTILYIYLLSIIDSQKRKTRVQNANLLSIFQEETHEQEEGMAKSMAKSKVIGKNYREGGDYEQNDLNQEINRLNANNNRDNIKVTDLKKVYLSKLRIDGTVSEQRFWAVKGLSFGVEPGQMFGLLGPNGAGKSSTFNMITGAFGRTGGNITLLGTPIEDCTPQEYQEVGICPQVIIKLLIALFNECMFYKNRLISCGQDSL